MSSAAVIFIFAAILLCGLVKKLPVFSIFTKGALDGIRSAISVLPALVGLMAMISALKASGLIEWLAKLLAPLGERWGVSSELLPLILLRPVSGSGALSYYRELVEQFGADSQIGRLGGILQGAGETVLYVASLYFGAVKSKKTGIAIVASLAGSVVGTVFILWIMKELGG